MSPNEIEAILQKRDLQTQNLRAHFTANPRAREQQEEQESREQHAALSALQKELQPLADYFRNEGLKTPPEFKIVRNGSNLYLVFEVAEGHCITVSYNSLWVDEHRKNPTDPQLTEMSKTPYHYRNAHSWIESHEKGLQTITNVYEDNFFSASDILQKLKEDLATYVQKQRAERDSTIGGRIRKMLLVLTNG